MSQLRFGRLAVLGAAVSLAAAGFSWTVGASAARAGSAGVAAHPSAAFTSPSRADDPAISASNPMEVNEPATVVGADGARYVAYQRGSQLSVTRDGGRTWSYVGGAQPASVLSRNTTGCSSRSDVGDVELTADRVGRVYFADLQVTTNSGANGADTGIEPIVAHSDNGFATYSGTCAAHQPASVDREWMAAYTAPHAGPGQSDVYLSYHDFGPNTMWVNHSSDGGRTWGQPVDVITSLGAAANSFCDTVPAGTAVDPRTGWVYTAWTAGSSAADNAATGCNYTQGAVFSTFYVAVSKDKGATWTPTQAFSGPAVTAPQPSDMSEIFGSLATDRQGGVYISFPAYLHNQYAAYAAYSPGADATGTLHFGPPVQVSAPGVHTAYFTRIVAGDQGRVDVIYLGSPVRNLVATPANKAAYTGADPNQPNCSPEVSSPGSKGVRFIGKPCEMPATAPWYLHLAQSVDLSRTGGTFSDAPLRADPVHVGDICTLGIFCLSGDNRDLADTNDVRIDSSGGAQVAYTYETPAGTRTEIDFQCQTGGTGLYAHTAVRSCRR